MQDAQYFRSQAELYFELSQRMSLHDDVEYFCIQAEHCLARAMELESESKQQPPTRPAH